MKNELASDSNSFTNLTGLIQLCSLQGGSRTQFAISCLNASIQADPPSPTSADGGHFIFISDEGSLYPPALLEGKIPLYRILLVKTKEAIETWRAAIEAVQTGLFSWVLLRPSRGCSTGQLRKLQLLSEKSKSRVLVFPSTKLPHWMFKASLEIGHEQTHSLFSGGKSFSI